MSLKTLVSNFLDGFGPGSFFIKTQRAGAPTQVFADDRVPFSMVFKTKELDEMMREFTASENGAKPDYSAVRTPVRRRALV